MKRLVLVVVLSSAMVTPTLVLTLWLMSPIQECFYGKEWLSHAEVFRVNAFLLRKR